MAEMTNEQAHKLFEEFSEFFEIVKGTLNKWCELGSIAAICEFLEAAIEDAPDAPMLKSMALDVLRQAFLMFQAYEGEDGATEYLKKSFHHASFSQVILVLNLNKGAGWTARLPAPIFGTPEYWKQLSTLFSGVFIHAMAVIKSYGANQDARAVSETLLAASQLLGSAKAFAIFCGDTTAAQTLSKLGTDALHAKNRERKQNAFAWLDANPPKPRGKANAARYIAKHFFVTEDTGKEWVKEWEKKRGGVCP